MADVKDIVVATWNGEDVKKRSDALARLSPFEIGLIVQGQAKLLAPVDTGRLRGSITTASGTGQKTSPSGEGAVGTDVLTPPTDPRETFVGTPVKYGPYQEYGTRATRAQPFLRPALDYARGQAPRIVEAGARKEFAEYMNVKSIYAQTNEAFSE